MTKEELQALITDTAKDVAAETVAPITDELKKQINDVVAKLKPPTDEIKTQSEADRKNFKSFGEFLGAIVSVRAHGKFDNRLVFVDGDGKQTQPIEQKATLVEGTDSAGGFLVPTEFRNQLLQVGIEQELIGSRAWTIPMATDTLEIPRIDDTSHASSLYGGVVAYWVAEDATRTETEPTFGQVKLVAKELSGYTKASNRLLQDNAVALESVLMKLFGDAYAWYRDLAFLRGTGSGQPLGILNSSALVSVTRQDTNNVVIKDIYNLYSRMLPGSRDRAVWFMNHDVLPELLAMTYGNVVPAAGDRGAFQPNLVDPIAKTILGRPFFVTEKMDTMGDAGDLGFFDLGYYIVGERQSLTIDASTHVYFTTNHTAWRFNLRCDGQPWIQSPITPHQGSNSLSPFLTLSAAS